MEKQPIITSSTKPWLDMRLSEEVMNHLWDNINHPTQPQVSATETLAGHVSKSVFVQDKDNWFYENVLKEPTEYVYYKEWNNYYEEQIAKIRPQAVFALESMWVNYQKQHEFNPPHNHSGMISFVVFMKIPTHWKEQHALPLSANANVPTISNFEFLIGQGEEVRSHPIPLSPEDEGRMLFFPAWLHHQVFPFYECEEERITLSGNISPIVGNQHHAVGEMERLRTILIEKETQLAILEKEVRGIRGMQNRNKYFSRY